MGGRERNGEKGENERRKLLQKAVGGVREVEEEKG